VNGSLSISPTFESFVPVVDRCLSVCDRVSHDASPALPASPVLAATAWRVDCILIKRLLLVQRAYEPLDLLPMGFNESFGASFQVIPKCIPDFFIPRGRGAIW
jgi:hypothetical protein